METNLFKSINLIRRGGGANLNLFRYAAMVLVLLLGVGNAWAGGGSTTYYANLTISKSGATGNGKVYYATSNTKPGSETSGALKSTGSTTQNANQTYYWWVDVDPGYNVTVSGKITAGPATAATLSGSVACAQSSSSGSGTSYSATANIVAVTVNSVSPTSVALDPTDASADYPFTVTFATSNLKTIALDLNKSPETADGKFTITNWSLDGTNVVANGKFNGGGSYGGANRNHSTTVSLQSKASGSAAKTCTVTANFPALAFVGVEATDVYATQGESGKTGSATFTYNYGAEDDFPTTPTLTKTSGTGAFTVTGYTVTPDFAKGETTVTVNYSFDTNNGIGETPATLTLTAANGDVRTVTVTGHSEAMATNDASVTTTANVTTEYATFAQALAAANATSGATLTLLRNVDLGTITTTNNITKAMTIDLNGKELRAAVNASSVGILTITQPVAVTIKDSKTGGKIINEVDRNSEVRTIFVNKAGATLTLESGTLAVNNLRQYASAVNADLGVTAASTACSARTIHAVAGSTVNINGGRVEAYGTRSVYGILQASSAATNKAGTSVLNISGGEIYAEGPYSTMGVYAYGKVNLSGGTITAHVTTNMIDARYAADATQNKYNGYGYGIYLNVSASATATSCYGGIMNMTGGTINVTNDREYNGNYPNYGILFNAAAANVSSATAVAADGKSHGQIASATGSIDGGEINVTSGTQYSYGVYVLGSYNSYDNTNHVVQIKNCKITSKAYVCAYGVYANAGINSTNGACYAGDVELTNCDIYAESLNTTTAAAVWVVATSATIFKDGTTANAATWGGEFAVAGKAVINNGKYESKTKTTTAYGAGTSTRAKTTYDAETTVAANRKRGGNAEAYPILIIHGGTFKATSTTSTARGVSNGGYCTIDGGEFEAYATTTTAHGLYCLTGKITASGVKVSASATGTAYGALADVSVPSYSSVQTGFAMAGELELNNCDITATTRTSTEARGVFVNATNKLHNWTQFKADSTSGKWAATTTYLYYKNIFPCTIEGRDSVGIAIAGKATINGCDIKATAATTTAYGVYSTATSVPASADSVASPVVNIKNTKFTVKTDGTTTAYGMYAGGPTTIDGCDFTVLPKTTTAYGVYIYDKKTTITNTKFDVKGTTTAYGIYANAAIGSTTGWDYHGEVELGEGNDMTVAATAGNTSHVLTLIAAKRNVASGRFIGDYANAALAHITGGAYKATATGTTSYVLNLSAQQVQGSAVSQPSCTIEGGKFWALASGGTTGVCTTNGVAGNILFKGGVYNVNTTLSKHIPEGYEEVPLASDRPEYTEGYRYEVDEAGMHGIDVCQIGSTKYKTLEEALQVVTSGQVIYMIANYTMTTPGDYVLPANTTLLIPYKTGSGAGATTAIGNSAKTTTSATTPSLFRKLTFGAGVNLTCFGTIETSAEQKANGQYGANVGMPSGAYGQIQMDEGSHISLEANSRLNCWGYITGKGTINVKKDAKILEGFQMGDWCGGTNYSNVFKTASTANYVFPITHYFYQSIECPVTYRPGSRAYGSTHVNVTLAGTVGQDDVPLVGTSGSMFIMDDNDVSADTWVMKDYDETTDQCIWTINSGASIGNLTISISGYNMKSASYDLPITTNMSIVLNYGEMAIGQNTVMLPGSKLIVNKQGTAVINGVTVVAYDAEDWAGSSRYFATYSPTWGTSSPRKNIPVTDAEVFLHGKVNIKGNGGLYTTPSGANVHSTNADAGEVIYTTAATGNKTSYYLNQGGTTRPSLTVSPAKLKNGDGSFASSAGTAAGKTWTYKNDVWDAWSKDGCFFMNAQDQPHAKPAALVQLTSKTPDSNHLHHDAATGTRNFVWDENCYWWEVSTTPTAEGYYLSLNADNNGDYNYYYYDNAAACWKIKKITITWNINGTTTNYSVGYGTKPEWLGATPTKTSSSSDYVWRWDGWTKGSDATVIANNDLPIVTENTTFTAHFYEKYYEYNVTFKNSDGTILDSRNWRAGTTPSYEGTPTKNPTVDYTYEFNGTWSPAITTVSGSATYTAQYTATPRAYTITFLNYDMSVLGTAEVVYNGTPSNETYLAAVAPKTEDPYKPDNSAFSFEFAGWRLQGASSNGFAQVKGDQTYVAQFNQTTKKYKVSFVDDDGETVLHYLQLEYGQTPSYTWANPSKQDAEWTYSFTGWTPATFSEVQGPQTYVANYNKTKRKYDITWVDGNGATLKTDQVAYGETPVYSGDTPTKNPTDANSFVFNNTWSPAIVAVVGEATYTAQFNETPRQYRVTWDAATNGGTCGTEYTDFSYNAAIGTLPVATKEGHTFNGWFTSATGGTQITTATKVTADVTYHAQFTVNTHKLAWNFNGGTPSGNYTEANNALAYGSTITYPTLSKTGYTFAGWSSDATSMPDADLTITASWTPNTNTAYTVKHYKQKLDGTYASTPDETDNLTGTTATEVTPAVKSYEGFDAPSTQKVTILADGSQVVTYQYIRKSYNLSWVADGDALTGTYTQGSTKYGAAISAPNTPTKTGYTFAGWSPAKAETMPAAATEYTATWTINQYTLTVQANDPSMGTVTGGGEYDYNSVHTIKATPNAGFKFVQWNDGNENAERSVTIPAENVTFTATFDYDIANYTVKHWQQNISDDNYTEVTGDQQVIPGTIGAHTAAEAKNYTGFKAQPFEQQTIVVGGNTINIYYNRETFTISWIVKLNGEIVDSKEETLRYGATPSFGPDPTKEQDDQYEYSFSGWTPTIEAVTENQTYEGTFDATARKYDVTWNNMDGTLIQKEENAYTYGAQPSFKGSTPEYSDGDPDKVYIFRGWKYERTGAEYKKDVVLPGVAGDETYTAVYTQMTAPVDVANGETKNITTNITTPTTTVHEGGMLKVQAGKALTTTTFILEASANASGQISETGTIEADFVYYDLKLNSPRRHWHAFGVPWAVDLAANPLTEVETGRTFVLGNDYDIIWYNTETRASSGPGAHCWEYVAHHDKTLTPGQGYMIAFTRDVQTVRFVKADGAPILYDQAVTVSGVGEGNNQGINALANPMAYHATLNAGPAVGYVHDGGEIGSDGYEEYDIENKSYVVGKTVYIQVQSNTTVAIAQSNAAPISKTLAPARRKAVTDKEYLSLNDYYRISISGAATDGGSVYVLPEEDKEDKYVVGHDLAKFGMSTKKAQIWIRRYDANLGLHTIAPIDGEAEFPINLYAPTAGEYTIANAFSPDDEYTVYLTRDGEAIWNLSDSPYTMMFNKGTVNGYGIRLAKKAPQIATGVDEAVVDAKGETRKVLVNDKVFIIRGDQVYSVDGQLVK